MGQWLKAVRFHYDLNQEEFARYIGKGRSAVAMYENGSPVPAETIALIRTAFPEAPEPPDISSAVKVAGAAMSVDDGEFKIRYAGVVPCSSNWGSPLEAQETRSIDRKFAGSNRFLCKVIGDSCYPALWQGDLTVWESDPNPPYGVIVIAERFDDQACTVKELQYDAENHRPLLVPINPAFDAPDDEEGWACSARLVGVIRQFDGMEKTWYLEVGLRARHLMQ